MNIQGKHCDPRQVDLFLNGQLDEDEQRAFEDHLEVCSVCQEALEVSAADRCWWQEAREYLCELAGDGPAAGTPELNARSALTWHDELTMPGRSLDFLSPTDDPRMLGRLGGYEVAGVIGWGGMSVVLKAFDPALNRYVALKCLAPHLAASSAARRRFAREAQAAAAVVHENVIAIHGVSQDGDLPYLVMPYVRGTSLQKRLNERGHLELVEVLRIGLQTARGLAAAHAQGLVHRDIKPANILLEEGIERLQITDFGLARAVDDASLTRSGVIAGTPQYMSPEQARGDPVDHRSDLFSLGSVMYTMCTGRPPFRAETSFGVLRRISDARPRAIRELNPAIPDWLVQVIEQLLAKVPEDRYQSADELADLLEQCLAHVQQPEVAELPPAVRSRTQTRIFQFGLAIAGAATLLMGALIWSHWTPDESAGNEAKLGNEGPPSSGNESAQQPETQWHDGLLEQMAALHQDAMELEKSVSRYWEKPLRF